ncbi:hypothetical protein [Mycetocola miduiensis]|uniref:Glycine zipper n=1 Tax=Mycetocola miduiensis TaxID=995034 RepID=A0A1I4ZWL7_9MICO|nr:hypothetical protein [Mycetocola miduiensis]SFN54460.1 hypothetical protein SAMN05216219_1132 [Mycetocola miduiensis]
MTHSGTNSSLYPALPGLGIALGAGAGLTIGVAIAGAPGIALGAAIGAGIGLVAGAVARDLFTKRPAADTDRASDRITSS